MNIKRIAILTIVATAISACGAAVSGGIDPPEDPDAPVLQVRSEGGFAPVEVILGQGPRYTLLADGRLIYEGPTIAIFPGPLVPNYQVTRIDDDEMDRVLDLVDEMGLPEMEDVRDDSAASMVADATTEVVTYWDDLGTHSYSVYALGIDVDGERPEATTVFSDLIDQLGELTAGEASAYEPEQVRVIAGPGFVNEEFEDNRDWPLDSTDLDDWVTLPNGWWCKVFGPEVLETFADANQTTLWASPDPDTDADLLKLVVRPLHPGEPDCPGQ